MALILQSIAYGVCLLLIIHTPTGVLGQCSDAIVRLLPNQNVSVRTRVDDFLRFNETEISESIVQDQIFDGVLLDCSTSTSSDLTFRTCVFNTSAVGTIEVFRTNMCFMFNLPLDVPVPENGSLSFSFSEENVPMAWFTCNDGFILVGDSLRNFSNYMWNGVQPHCEDVDECVVNSNLCEYNCTNTIGSFVCSGNPASDPPNFDNTAGSVSVAVPIAVIAAVIIIIIALLVTYFKCMKKKGGESNKNGGGKKGDEDRSRQVTESNPYPLPAIEDIQSTAIEMPQQESDMAGGPPPPTKSLAYVYGEMTDGIRKRYSNSTQATDDDQHTTKDFRRFDSESLFPEHIGEPGTIANCFVQLAEHPFNNAIQLLEPDDKPDVQLNQNLATDNGEDGQIVGPFDPKRLDVKNGTNSSKNFQLLMASLENKESDYTELAITDLVQKHMADKESVEETEGDVGEDDFDCSIVPPVVFKVKSPDRVALFKKRKTDLSKHSFAKDCGVIYILGFVLFLYVVQLWMSASYSGQLTTEYFSSKPPPWMMEDTSCSFGSANAVSDADKSIILLKHGMHLLKYVKSLGLFHHLKVRARGVHLSALPLSSTTYILSSHPLKGKMKR